MTSNTRYGHTLHRPLVERCLLGLALAGVLITIHLTFWYGGDVAAEDPVCGAGFDCEAVLASDPAPLGIASTYWGMVFYLTIAGLGLGIAFKSEGIGRRFHTLRRAVIGGGLLYSIFLTVLQFVVLSDRCLLCLISAFLVTSMVVVLLLERTMGTPVRVVPAREARVHIIMVGVASALILGDYAYSGSRTADDPGTSSTAQVLVDPSQCRYDGSMPTFANTDQLVRDYDPIAGRRDAPVTIIEFLDPNCPHCKSLHPTMQQLLQRHPEKVRIVYKPVTLVGGPSYSLEEVMALWLAEEEGRFEEMLESMFRALDGSSGLTVDALVDLADDIGLDPGNFRSELMSGRLINRSRNLLQAFNEMGFSGVPAVLIEGRVVHSNSRNLGCMSHFVEQIYAEKEP